MTDVSFIGIIPRARDLHHYSDTATSAVRWCAEAGLDGVLIFTGTGAVLDPWVVAAAVASTSPLVPLVAVNPVYQHPYTAARMVASIGLLYERRVDLNLITGTAVSDLASLGDDIDHDDRYDRLAEYVKIMMALLSSPRPLSYEGRFYRVSRLQLTPALPESLLPRLFLGGQSPAAQRVALQTGATSIRMLSPAVTASDPGARALNFGVITRASGDDAVRAAQALFPANPLGERVMAAGMSNTDSTWKRRLFDVAAATDGNPYGTCWLKPFRSGQADCPYLVAGYQEVADRLTAFARAGVRAFVIEAPVAEAEFRHLARAVRLTRDQLRAAAMAGQP